MSVAMDKCTARVRVRDARRDDVKATTISNLKNQFGSRFAEKSKSELNKNIRTRRERNPKLKTK